MTPVEINIAVAEECDLRPFVNDLGECLYWHREAADTPMVARRVPDYYHDLNAMREAEKTLSEKEQVFYLTKLLQVRYRTGADHGMIACMQDKLAFATAAQRAEAFLRVRNKWRE